MTRMNKLTYSTLMLLATVMSFAQQSREARPDRFPYTADSSFDDGGFGGGPEDNFATPGGNTPVDQYTYLLLGLAVVLIAYFLYTRNRQIKKA